MKRHGLVFALCGLSQMASAYELHEWGTFTTVSGSGGELLTGLHVEEEHLPPFVYSHIGMKNLNWSHRFMPQLMSSVQNGYAKNANQMFVLKGEGNKIVPMSLMKGMPMASLSNVTVKMETPVIYFYGDDAGKVNVKVGFNGGTISQWYPQRKSGDTPNKMTGEGFEILPALKKELGAREMVLYKPLDFSKMYEGGIEWDVEVIPKAESDPAFTFKADETTTWIYPRVSDANMLKVGDEYEDFLFYRGIGNFPLPVVFSVDAEETLHVENKSNEAVPFAFAFENIEGKFRYSVINSVEPGKTATVKETEWTTPVNQQVEVFQQMRKGLMAQGLSLEESNGMIKTWWQSYFGQPGLRVFWVVPQGELEKTLPLTLSPAPEKQVRVLVGRADVMRPRLEKKMIAALGTHEFKKFQSDRFILPYTNRLKQLIKEPVYQKFDAKNIMHVSLMLTAKRGSSELGEGINLYENSVVKAQHLKLKGKWRVEGDDVLVIGDTHFKLDPKTGILTADAQQEGDYDVYEIQLPKVLN